MDAFALRLAADRERIRSLAQGSQGRIVIISEPTAAYPRCELELRYATAASPAYPSARREASRVSILFGERYPFLPPSASFLTPIHHPNVYPSGLVCLGTRWLASEGMDLFVQRLIRLMTFDPLLVNVHSAANPAALHWYLQARAQHPEAFPTERVTFDARDTGGNVRWHEQETQRVVIDCPRCRGKLRLPAGRRGVVRCPRCGAEFEATT